MTVPYCAKCGAPARSGARFCAACGAELPDTATGRTGTVIAATPPELVEAPPTASAKEQVPAADAPMLASVPPTAPLVPPSQPTPQSAIGAAAAGAPARFPNAVLGWFVVGSLVLPLVSGTEANPTPTVFAVILMLGLVVSRVRKKRFGKHWLLAAAIIGDWASSLRSAPQVRRRTARRAWIRTPVAS